MSLARTILFLCLLALGAAARGQGVVTILDPTFSMPGGQIAGKLDLNIFDGPPGTITMQLGSSPWYGMAEAMVSGNTGFRAGIEVNTGATSPGVGLLRYDLGGSLGALLGGEMPAAYLWQRLPGQTLQAHTTYTLSLDLTTSSLLSLGVLGDFGFGFGLTTGASASSYGTFVGDSLSAPGLLSLSLLGGAAQRLTYSFTTGANPAAGDIGFTIFAGRGEQGLSLSLLTDFRIDNVALSATAIPEPSPLFLLLPAALFLRPRRRLTA